MIRPRVRWAPALVLGCLAWSGCAGLLKLEDRTADDGTPDAAPLPDEAAADAAPIAVDGSLAPDVAADAPRVSDAGTPVDAALGDETAPPPKTPIALVPASAGMNPAKLAQDDAYLYFSDLGSGGIFRIAKTGGTPTPYWEGLSAPYPVAVDDANVYWGDVYGVWTCPKTGCPAGAETQVAPSPNTVLSVAIDALNVYWVDDIDNEVFAAPLHDGGARTLLWTGGGVTPDRIATDGARVFFTASDGVLHVVGIDGGAVSPAKIGSRSTAGSQGVTVQGSNVLWTQAGSSGAVFQTPVAALSATTVLAPGEDSPPAVASDGTNVFWLGYQGDAGVLRGCVASACTPTTLVSGLDTPRDVVVDSTAIYFSDESHGEIWKLPR